MTYSVAVSGASGYAGGEILRLLADHPDFEVRTVTAHANAGQPLVAVQPHLRAYTHLTLQETSAETLASLREVIDAHFAPLIVGRSPFAIASIMHALDQAIYHSLYAQATISDALFDLQGKILGVPVYDLLGGKCRDRAASCAVLFMMPTLKETLASAEQFCERGFRSLVV